MKSLQYTSTPCSAEGNKGNLAGSEGYSGAKRGALPPECSGRCACFRGRFPRDRKEFKVNVNGVGS